MTAKEKTSNRQGPGDLLLAATAKTKTLPVYFVRERHLGADLRELGAPQRAWLKATGFTGVARTHALLPGDKGALSGAVLGIGAGDGNADGANPGRYAGLLPGVLPAGSYHLAETPGCEGVDMQLASVAWALGGYRFTRYLDDNGTGGQVRLKLGKDIDARSVLRGAEAVWLGRDLINTPAGDMGPEELEDAARALAKRHGAKVSCIKGDDLIAKGFPLIHAVGRAATRAPRLIDMRWGKAGAPRVTLVGKGICFDTGGLDIKTASGMLLMKKDMGGAAAVLGLAHMIMDAKLALRLRVLIPAAENAIAGNAFRPGDIITSRAGLTVEIGNTDAEGRLVLADALAFADEEKPDYLMTFATLTGAARVALGPDLPPFYVDDDAFAATLQNAGSAVCDPLWRMPFWSGYESMLNSAAADLNNVAFGGFAGSITAALFLRRFVSQADCYTHFDIYGWRPTAGALGPKGGEPQAVRAVFAALEATLSA